MMAQVSTDYMACFHEECVRNVLPMATLHGEQMYILVCCQVESVVF